MILNEYFDGIGTPRTLSLKYDVFMKTIENWIAKTNDDSPMESWHGSLKRRLCIIISRL